MEQQHQFKPYSTASSDKDYIIIPRGKDCVIEIDYSFDPSDLSEERFGKHWRKFNNQVIKDDRVEELKEKLGGTKSNVKGILEMPLTVCEIQRGTYTDYYLIDGQHRLEALRLLKSENKHLKFIVQINRFLVNDETEMNAVFSNINQNTQIDPSYLDPLNSATLIECIIDFRDKNLKMEKIQGNPPAESLKKEEYIKKVAEWIYDKKIQIKMINKLNLINAIVKMNNKLSQVFENHKIAIDEYWKTTKNQENSLKKNIKDDSDREFVALMVHLFATKKEMDKRIEFAKKYKCFIGILANKTLKEEGNKAHFKQLFWDLIEK